MEYIVLKTNAKTAQYLQTCQPYLQGRGVVCAKSPALCWLCVCVGLCCVLCMLSCCVPCMVSCCVLCMVSCCALVVSYECCGGALHELCCVVLGGVWCGLVSCGGLGCVV